MDTLQSLATGENTALKQKIVDYEISDVDIPIKSIVSSVKVPEVSETRNMLRPRPVTS